MSDTQAVVVASPISEAHKSISQAMIENLISTLVNAARENKLTIQAYGVSDYSWKTSENLNVQIQDGPTIQISVDRGK